MLKFSTRHDRYDELQRHAQAAINAKDWGRAVTLLEELLALPSYDALAHVYLGLAYTELRKLPAAVRVLRRALELDRFCPDTYNQLGAALFYLKEFHAAEAFFEVARNMGHPQGAGNLAESRKAARGKKKRSVSPAYQDLVRCLDEIRPRLSLCMIVKNEERFLPRCLEAVKGVVDEIIIVDTGSTDRTVEIAREHGARVEFFPWTGDFSAARNESIKYATGDWILWLDADEELDPACREELRQVLYNRRAAGFDLVIDSYVGADGAGEHSVARIFRIFPNHPEVKFYGRIHEQIVEGAIRVTGYGRVPTNVRVMHHGYTTEMLSERNKLQRNLDMLFQQRDEEPDNAYVYFQLSRTYQSMGNWGEALPHNAKALELLKAMGATRETSIYPALYENQVQILNRLGRHPEALAAAEEAECMYPDYPDLLFQKGMALMGMRRYDEAVRCYEACRAYKDTLYQSSDPSLRSYNALNAIAQAYSLAGDWDQAVDALKRALAECHYENPLILGNLAKSCYQALRWGEAEHYFNRVLAQVPNHPEANHFLSLIRQGIAPAPPQKPSTLSVCMIVKDEEAVLDRCLRSIQGVADEIVVVDTGSTDRTVAIAEQHGAKVHHYPWNADFSAARNEALRHATGDWILVLDADEALAPESREELRRVLANREVAGYDVAIESFVNEQERGGFIVNRVFRLFPNHPQIRFAGRVHEQVLPSALQATHRPMANSGIRIQHWGYLKEVKEAKGKNQRDLDLLLRQRDDFPDDPYTLYQLAHTYLRMGRPELAAEPNERAIALLNAAGNLQEHSYYRAVYRNQITLLMQLGRHEDALAASHEAERRCPEDAEIRFNMGLALMRLNRLEEAVNTFHRCRATPLDPMTTLDPHLRSFKAMHAIGQCAARAGRWSDAAGAFRQAIAECPYESPLLLVGLAEALLHLGEPAAAHRHAARAVELDPAISGGRDLLARLETSAGKAPTLSLCMIVKNEERFLARCLQSVQGVVDQIVVVDTGSTDRTVEIARSFGAEVHSYAWDNHFAAARNESLKHATGEWILWLDADEELLPESREELRKVLWRRDVAGFDLEFLCLRGAGDLNDYYVSRMFRIFPNHPSVRFEGRIHEQVIESAVKLKGKQSVPTTVKVLHHGYTQEMMQARNKLQRNLDLLLVQRDEEPDNPYVYYQISNTLQVMGRYPESLEPNTRSIEILKGQGIAEHTSYYPMLLNNQVRIFFHTQRFEEALTAGREAERLFPSYPDLLYDMGLSCIRLNRTHEALDYFRRARGVQHVPYPNSDPSLRTYQCLNAMGHAYSLMGRWSDALSHFQQAIAEAPPGLPMLHMNAAKAYANLGRLDEAIAEARIAERFDPNCGATQFIAEVSQRLPSRV